jgi:hypothetical protein
MSVPQSAPPAKSASAPIDPAGVSEHSSDLVTPRL